MSDDEVIAALTQVKGIGRWSAEMFLMFRLRRPDVLPVGDLGIVNAIKNVYRLRKKPDADRIRKIGEAWRPYRIGSVLVPLAKPRQRALKNPQRMNRLHRLRPLSSSHWSSHRPTRSSRRTAQEVGRHGRSRTDDRSSRSTRPKARG